MSYTAPNWCRPPSTASGEEDASSAWSIDEIKGGVIVAKHQLKEPSSTFGRATDVVTIPTLHESCSRVHARIAFDGTGTAWLRDLGAANGTTVNGRRMPPQSIGKEIFAADGSAEREGARGVIVYPGDTIRFGASTRIYVLNGPAEFDRGAMKAKLEAAKLAKLNADLNKQQEQEGSGDGDGTATTDDMGGVSWGIDMSDATDYQQDEGDLAKSAIDASRPILETDVPDKYRKLFENLRSKRYKLDAIMEESQRIEAKGNHGELSEGQKSRLEQNRTRIEELNTWIEEADIELREKIAGRSQGNKRKADQSSSRRGDDDDDVDTFYDRTAEVSKKRGRRGGDYDGSDEAETEQSLRTKWKMLISDYQKNKAEANAMQIRRDRMAAKVAAAEANGDEDAFFLKNDLDLLEDTLKKLTETSKTLDESISQTEKLLKVVNDKLIIDRSTSFVGLESELPKSKEILSSNKSNGGMMPPPPKVSNASMMPPPPKVSNASMMPPPPKPSLYNDSMMPPPPPAKPSPSSSSGATSGDGTMPPPAIVTANPSPPSAMAPPPPKRSRPFGPAKGAPAAGGTLAAIRSAVGVPNGSDGRSSSQRKVPGAMPPPSGFPTSSSSSKEDTWTAPEGQDGSGMTKLNKKFAGRY